MAGNLMFGEYRHQIDAKGRIRIPPKLKLCLDGAMVTRGTNGCLFLFSQTEFAALIEKAKNIPVTNAAAQAPLRMFFSSSFELEEDEQGRSLVPRPLREAAKLSKDIVIIGVGSRAEIWDAETYNEYFKGQPSFDEALAKLGEYGI